MLPSLQYFLLAVGFFTRIPVPAMPDFDENQLNHAAKYFPLVGVIVGLVGALAYCVSAVVLPHALAVLVSMAATIYLTGAFHEDGLADSADGLGGGWQREKILTIMQDSRLGTYGAVALFLMLFTKFQALNHLPSSAWSLLPVLLIVAHALSRLCAVWLMALLPYAKPDGKAKPLATQLSRLDILLGSTFGLLPFLGFLFYLSNQYSINAIFYFSAMVLLTLVALLLWWRSKLKKWIGGYTGDTLGALQQMSELAIYLVFLAWVMKI